jgi:hypothetical protein
LNTRAALLGPIKPVDSSFERTGLVIDVVSVLVIVLVDGRVPRIGVTERKIFK